MIKFSIRFFGHAEAVQVAPHPQILQSAIGGNPPTQFTKDSVIVMFSVFRILEFAFDVL